MKLKARGVIHHGSLHSGVSDIYSVPLLPKVAQNSYPL